jgi:hypothetical protein
MHEAGGNDRAHQASAENRLSVKRELPDLDEHRTKRLLVSSSQRDP